MTNKLKRCKTCNKTENKVKFRTTYKECNKCIYNKRKDYLKAYSISYYHKYKKDINKSKINKPKIIKPVPIKINKPLLLDLSFNISY